MTESASQLAALPVELLHNIFRHLDPVALIATSQTSTHFRSIILPTKKHFAERLLALEMEPEHGGPGFTYFAREGRLEPDWNEDEWNYMRWACTCCLRLLRHSSFDNHSLLRLKNRKPLAGSAAAKLYSGVTSWEPSQKSGSGGKTKQKKKARVTEEREQEKLLRKQYHMATTKILNTTGSTYTIHTRTSYLKAAELEEALELTDSQLDLLTEGQEHALLDRAAHCIERLRTGSHRHLRKCNECRFELGQFKKSPLVRLGQPADLTWAFTNNKGTSEVPVVRSRRLNFNTPFDRYFPGIEPYMLTARASLVLPLWRIHRRDTTFMPTTTYMVRCPSCTVWQELRAFRWVPRGWGYGEYIGIGRWATEAEAAAHCEEVRQMLGERTCLSHLVLDKSHSKKVS